MTRYRKNGDPINEVAYEWAIEIMDEWGDIIDIEHSDKLTPYFLDSLRDAPSAALALIRSYGNDANGEQGRGYAYAKDGVLEPEFDTGHKVPAKYLKQLEAA